MDVSSQAESHTSSTPSPDEIDAISSRRFSSSFRGWNPDEVRVHLVEIAEMVRSLTHRQSDLERQLAEAEAAVRRADLTRLDPDEVGRVLGEETARVLRAARESAAEIEAKAAAQTEVLVRQAADDAARMRAEAQAEARATREDAEETASAIRTAGEAHVDDLRAAAEADIAHERAEMHEQLSTEIQTARDASAAETAAAEDRAAATRRAAAEDADSIRSEAEADAARLREATDAELAEQRSRVEHELHEQTSAAAEEAADAERLRDRVLADLARKRRAARQHLEQLHAGRDRLLAAYEVIRVTTDQATEELDVVLGEAKHQADEAARRTAAEPLATPDEMLAELQAARPLGPPPAPPTPAAESLTAEGAGTEEAGDGPSESAESEADPSAADVPDVELIETEPAPPDEGDASGSVEPDASDATAPDPEAAAAERSDDVVPSPEPGAERMAIGDSPGVAQRLPGRRGKARPDPLGGEALPDIPMEPVTSGAEFESVRVMTPDEVAAARQALAKPADGDAEPTADAGGEASVAEESVPEPEPEPVSEREPEPVPAARTTASVAAPVPTPVPAAGKTRQVPGSSAAEPPVAATGTSPKPPAGASSTSDRDPATDIFARLRAERAQDDDPEPKQKQKQESDPEPKQKQKPEPKSKSKADPESQQKPEPEAEPTGEPETAGARDQSGSSSGPDDVRGGFGEERLAEIFERRDAAVDEVARRLSKHLKRELSDQQSELLDELRRSTGPVSADALLGDPETFAASWVPVIEGGLAGAVSAGAALVGDLRDDVIASPDVDLALPTDELIDTIAVSLRARLVRALDEDVADVAEGEDADVAVVDDLELADRIRACYREWRGARLASAVSDVCARALGMGVRGALPSAVGLRWHSGPGDPPCSDCNDNALAGVIGHGETFPTGQQVAPAHPGCRCLALPDPT